MIAGVQVDTVFSTGLSVSKLSTRALDSVIAYRDVPIRRHIHLPVGVGFGIKDAETAARVARVADAVIVGSAIVQRIEKLAATPRQIPETVATFLGELRGAIDGAGRH